MARLNLRCGACGFYFTVTDTQASKPEGVHCPSCMAPVGIDGPPEGGPGKKPARVLSGGADASARKMKIMIGAGAGLLVLIVVIAILVFGGSTPPPPPVEISKKKLPTFDSPPEPKKPAVLPVENKPAAPKADPKPNTAPVSGPTTPAPAPKPAAPSPQGVPLPTDAVQSVRENVLTLKTWHLNLVVPPADKLRMDALMASGKGALEDAEFLRSLGNSPQLRVVREEAALIKESRERLEKEAFEGLPVDKVVMSDGRVLHGKVVEETEAVVRLEKKVSSGSSSVMPLPKADVKEVQKGKGAGSEFRTKWDAAAKEGRSALVTLLAWCKESSLPLQSSLVAFAILSEDPGRSEARQQVGLPADPVARMVAADKQGGFITYEGRRWVPTELKERLIRDGNLLVDGRWLKGTPKIISLPGLFKTDGGGQVQVSGQLANEEVTTYSMVGGEEKVETKTGRRFYTAEVMSVTASRKTLEPTKDMESTIIEDHANPLPGAAMRSEVSITVPVGVPILEASVMTASEVRGGAEMTVYLLVGGRRDLAYKMTGRDSASHKLPDSVRGRTEVVLVVEINAKAAYSTRTDSKRIKAPKKDTDRVIERGKDWTFKQMIPEYTAMLFPSNANTIEVFRLTAMVGEPAPALDKLFENAPDILKQ